MKTETLLLLAAILVATSLCGAALVFQHRGRSMRARLVVLFVALTLIPSLLTLMALWRELGPRSRLHTSEGVDRSMQAALVLARHVVTERYAEAQRLADRVAGRLRGHAPADSVGLADLFHEPCVVLRFEPREQRAACLHGNWSVAASAAFLSRREVGWPQERLPAQIVSAPDSSRVVVGVAALGDAATDERVLVALPVPVAEAQAIQSIVDSVRHSKGLRFLEELKLETAAQLMGGLALVYIFVAVVLGVLLARTLTRPIEELRRAFEAVAAGELGRQVRTRTGDGELSQLIAGFNRMSRELQESKAELVRAARLAAWQDVARRLAHEIKNPLTPITLSIHRIRRRASTDDAVVRECLDTVLEETSHLERLANEFSTFARLPKPVLARIEPGEVLEQVLELYSAHPGVHLRAEIDGIPAVLADRDQVRQVFTNLVKNAIEAMPEGGELEVRWARDDGHVALTFLDSGSGFQPEALEHLFDPTFTTKSSGSGLGLAIVRRILEDHGGDIVAGNRPESGAWVRVRLPEAR